MKFYLYVTTALIVGLSTNAVANSADTVCTISDTDMTFNISSSTPATEGSRFFQDIQFSRGPKSKPTLTITQDSSEYITSYADGVLTDGAAYFMIRVRSRTGEQVFYAFLREASATRSAYSEVTSRLTGFYFDSMNGTLNCKK